jgi:dehydrogenase/reductase SDR family protein 12
MREYTKGGYQTASKNFNSDDLEVDLSNKSIMVTGSNSGIGKITALEVAKRKATVHMLCRNRERGEKAQQEIIKESKNSNVFLHIVDMAQPRQVFNFAQEFLASGRPLNILVNNAGCMENERKSFEGLELNFVTNTLSTYILTKTLLPLVAKSDKPRIVR